jgi:hypothetical protein
LGRREIGALIASALGAWDLKNGGALSL